MAALNKTVDDAQPLAQGRILTTDLWKGITDGIERAWTINNSSQPSTENVKVTSLKDESYSIPKSEFEARLAIIKDVKEIPVVIPLRPSQKWVWATQEWEGCVTEILRSSFKAFLVDLTNHNVAREEAEFPIAELSDSEHEKLYEGAIFRWVIGYQKTESGNKTRSSGIYFRRTKDLTKSDYKQAKAMADSWARIEWI